MGNGHLAVALLALLSVPGLPALGRAAEAPQPSAGSLGLRPTDDPGRTLCLYPSEAAAAGRSNCHRLEGGPGWYARDDRLAVLDETPTVWRVIVTPPAPAGAGGDQAAAPAPLSPAEADRMVAGLEGRLDPEVVALVRAQLLAGAGPRTIVRALQAARPDVFGPTILSALCAAAPARCGSQVGAPVPPPTTPLPAIGYVRKDDPAVVAEVRMRPAELGEWRLLLRPLAGAPADGSRLVLIAALLDGLQQAFGLRIDTRSPEHLGMLLQRSQGLPGADASRLLDRSFVQIASPQGLSSCGARTLLQRARVGAGLLDLVAAGTRAPVLAPAPVSIEGCGGEAEDRLLAPLPEVVGAHPLGPDQSYSWRHATAAGEIVWVPLSYLP